MLFPVVGMRHKSGDEGTYGDLLISMVDANQTVFSVSTCNDARVALSQLPGIFTHFTYELSIGAQSNSKTTLKGAVGGAILVEVDTPAILDCQNLRSFWISWRRGELSFGKGSVPEQGRVLFYQDANSWHDVNALSFATNAGSVGVWDISVFTGENYNFCNFFITSMIQF